MEKMGREWQPEALTPTKAHSKSTGPRLKKFLNGLTLPDPPFAYSKSHVCRLNERGCGQGHLTLSTHTLVQAAFDLVHTHARAGGRHGSSPRADPGLEVWVHHTSFTCWGLCSLRASVLSYLQLCAAHNLASERFGVSAGLGRALMKNVG